MHTMRVLSDILSVTFPFFALVLCGYAVALRAWVADAAIPSLNFYVMYLALPAMLLRFAASTPIVSLLDPSIVLTHLICATSMVVLTLILTRRGLTRWNDASFGALVAAFPNSGFMGVPLLVALLGSSAAAPAIVALSLDMVVTTSLCIALSRVDTHAEGGARHAARRALWGVLANPLPWAILLGSGLSASQWALPQAIDALLTLLAQSASPVALFTLGCVLARSYRQSRDHPSTRRSDVSILAALKLLVHPAWVWCTGQVLMAVGLPLTPFSAMVLVLMAALPSASNVPMLAERFGADAGRLARVVMFTTAAAFVTFTFAVMVVVPASGSGLMHRP